MNARAYVLPDVINKKAGQMVQALRSRPGVVMAAILEGPPDVALIVKAPNRRKLAKLTIEALVLVESATENICLLPVRNGPTALNEESLHTIKSLRRKTKHA